MRNKLDKYRGHVAKSCYMLPVTEAIERRMLLSGSIIYGSVEYGRSGDDEIPETLYLDANNNGKPDPGEITTTSATDGSFEFTNVPPGNYVVRQELPYYKVQVEPANNYGVHITITSTPSAQEATFLNAYLLGGISGTVYDDSNNDGAQDAGDTPIDGLTVYLDENNNGRYDSGEPISITNSTGNYSFSVFGGNYIVRAELPASYAQVSPANGYGHHVTVVGTLAGTNDVSNENFILKAPAGSVSGNVFDDVDKIQTQYDNPGLAGWTVYLDLNDDGKLDAGDPTTMTDVNGNYQFASLPGGTFTVRVDAPVGWAESFPSNNAGQTVTFPAGGSATDANFGFFQLPTTLYSILGTVFNDVNGDGAQEGGEAGLSGWSVYLDMNNDGVYDAGDVETTTGLGGVYGFGGLNQTNYVVRVEAPADWVQTYPASNYGQHVALTSTSIVSNANFGFQQKYGTITGGINVENTSGNAIGWTVYLDLNNNGKLDPGEPIATITSGLSYTFNDLVPGNYIVRVAAPAGWTQVSPGDNYGHHVTVVAGQSGGFVDFNFTRKGAGDQIQGTVFNDANGNGTLDSGESGLAGWFIFIDPQNSGETLNDEAYAMTDSNGDYYFDALSPGTYTLTIEGNAYYQQTTPADNGGYQLIVTANQDATGYNFGEQLIS